MVALWRFPGAFDNVSTAHMDKVRAMAAGGGYRSDVQSADWVGVAIAEVLGLDPETDRRRIKALLKVWIGNRALKIVQRKDARRHEKSYVVPGDFKE